MSEGGREAIRTMMGSCPPPCCACWKHGCAISNGCSATIRWRTRSSRRLSTSLGQKKRSCCRALRRRTVPDEDDHRQAGPCPLEHRRARKGMRPKRGPQNRDGDPELSTASASFCDSRELHRTGGANRQSMDFIRFLTQSVRTIAICCIGGLSDLESARAQPARRTRQLRALCNRLTPV
jgi:hypothetical protein